MLQKNENGNEKAKFTRITVLLIYDMIAVFMAEVLSIWTRFDFSLQNEQGMPYLETAFRYLIVNILTTLVIFMVMHLYNSLWQYASVQELLNVVIACLLSSALQSVGMHMLQWSMPRSYYILYFFFLLAFIAGSRFVYRALRIIRHNYIGEFIGHAVPTMIIGAGDSAYFLMKNMTSSNQIRNKVVCVMDADKGKIGSKILGAPIVGDDSKIPWAAENMECRKFLLRYRICRGYVRKRYLNCARIPAARSRYYRVWHRS